MAKATIERRENAGLPQIEQVDTSTSTVRAGETEELRREFSVWSLGSLIVCLMATWEALGTVVAQALTNGGPPCLLYN